MSHEIVRGLLSLLPVVLTLFLAFRTKDAVFSLLAGCAAGAAIVSFDPATGVMDLVLDALGNRNFIWITMIEIAVGIMIAFYMRAGVIHGFAEWASGKIRSRRGVMGFSWLLGVSIFFSANFSPLFAGPIAKPLTDRHRVSREMLAYLLDSGSAPVCTLIPLSGWAVYIAGLLEGYGPITTAEQGIAVFIRSIPFNLYGWFAVALSGLIAFGILPNVGPMKKAERRALDEGKVIRDGATPVTGDEFSQIRPRAGRMTHLVMYLAVPIAIILAIAIGSFIAIRRVMILEAFLAAVLYQSIALSIGKCFASVTDAVDVAVKGVKAVLPAILILALAYCINAITKTLGTQQFIISVTRSWMTAGLLPLITFLTGAVISFFTGTSWGTYAILSALVLPIAMNLSGGEISVSVLATVGAIVSGGLFGDHCSPISDTTCLSSFGAGSDHMDHVETQLPYALIAAGCAAVALLVIGLASA